MKVFIVALMALLLVPLPTVAQVPAAADLFPRADVFGNDWTLTEAVDGDISQWPSFQRFSAAIYLGPDGGRLLIGIISVNAGDAATREAWTLANGMFDQYRSRFDADISTDSTIASDASIPGCANSRHIQGVDRVIPAIPVGLSLCATDSNRIVLAYASGEISGLIGRPASDHVISAVLA